MPACGQSNHFTQSNIHNFTTIFLSDLQNLIMKDFLLLSFLLLQTLCGGTQNVGIGTSTPNVSAILDISGTSGGLLLPRLTTTQMNNMDDPARGLIIYNTTLQRPYGFYGNTASLPQRWRSMGGPEVLAWGFVDSCNTPCGIESNDINPVRIISGSGNFNVRWVGGDSRWYEIIPSQSSTWNPLFTFGNNRGFSIDSMMLIITPVGNGTWDLTPSVGSTTISPTDVRATVKFTDISRMSSDNFSTTSARRRSKFYFVMYRIN
jgi:hypothetical protein